MIKLKRVDIMSYEKEKYFQQLQEKLEWVKYRLKMLDIIERKLYEMKEIAENASNDIGINERIELNKKVKYLESQVNALDEESRYE
ncbi:hypothetical protein Ccar_25115 [Clostridium carboxidivorans P7]|uniref:Uncharacterized protein n=1 Tax=Clostridium carboxidivorans P7 TaxID=536227 RepID=C6PPH4_9CLOT|nr:hypothetical protein [Clostridium carboxidivorans]AKN33930.1 hypothetical protein Ccar_25115 [Clostridium carboxidivorans P7]EET88868.1 conserved hypothetical protein [Clostridium carboxidivorans P7]